MAYSLTDFKLYDEQLYAGQFESMATNAGLFNEASLNSIVIVPAENKGLFKKEAFLKDQDFISRLDRTSVASANATYVTMGEAVAPKLSRRFQIDMAVADIQDLGATPEELSFIIGQRIAEKKMKDYRDTAFYAALGALNSNNAVYDATSLTANTCSIANILGGLKLMGDQAENISALAMHSVPMFDLMSVQISDKIAGIADIVAYNATPASLNRRPLVADSAALVSSNVYSVIGLGASSLVVEESDALTSVWGGVVTGGEQLVYRVQGQYSYNVKIKGYSYTSATSNPTSAGLATSSNWALVNSSIKSGAGFIVKVKPSA